jgi:glucose-6-phosphate isomerase
MNDRELWQRYHRHLCTAGALGLQVDISRMTFDDSFLASMVEPMARAFDAMDQLEQGALANRDENRMVGHYWLRTPGLTPDEETRAAIQQTVTAINEFAEEVQTGSVTPEKGDGFFVVLVIGIGGSALGPQFVCDALGGTEDPILIRFLDNTDPDGIDRVLGEIEEAIEQTLTIVISKSGGTIEVRNAMRETAAAYERAGLDFAKHAVAVTCEGSALHREASENGWLRVFPMWNWVGGRTSVTSAVGLLPAALQGIDIDGLLAGARECDAVTRSHDVMQNPAALLALMWHYAGEGRGGRNMVVIPYRDRLVLFSRYLQQLVMESLGKECDRDGNVVQQGLTVYGNKGTTDQHAYVQQLREGLNDFFVTFIDVRRDRTGESIMVEEDVTSGDYLSAFRQGTRTALYENGRESITITIEDLTAFTVGVLIALFERAVGLYAELININAYHQPGVEAGKKAASAVIDLQRRLLAHLRAHPGTAPTVEQIAEAIGLPDSVETAYHILEHAAANGDHRITRTMGKTPMDTQYSAS